MTQKGQQIMKRMRERDRRRRVLARLNDPRHREHLLDSLNKNTMDAAAPVGGGSQEMKVLKEMNYSPCPPALCVLDIVVTFL
jgi:hypothetical protein